MLRAGESVVCLTASAVVRRDIYFRFTPPYDFRLQEFILAEFEFQIDELLHKLDVISGAATSSSSTAPPPLSGFPPFAHSSSSAETKESSGAASKSGSSAERRHLPAPSGPAPAGVGVDGRRLAGIDDQLFYEQDRDLTQLVDLSNFEAGLRGGDNNDKVRS